MAALYRRYGDSPRFIHARYQLTQGDHLNSKRRAPSEIGRLANRIVQYTFIHDYAHARHPQS